MSPSQKQESQKTEKMTHVPFGDLYAQYLTIKPEIDHVISDVIAKSAFVRGAYVENFEQDFAKAIGKKHCVSCANGTDALYIAMHALDIKPGDEVITTAHSWISTSETITQAGGKVVFCDTEKDSFLIDPRQIESLITPRTVGIIPVHLYGQAADMKAIMAIAKRHDLWVIEDCAQAHLATFQGQTVGTFGTVGTFSFYPGKNLGAMGDAGAIVTDDAALQRRMAMFSRHGGITKGIHEIEGINSRLDGLQAAILGVKLPHLKGWTQARQKVAARYDARLADNASIMTPTVLAQREHAYHLYVIRHGQRDSLAEHLKTHGVQTVINYRIALPFLEAYGYLNHKPEEFPNAFENQSKILSLPIFPEMTTVQTDYVIDAVQNFKG